MPRYSLNVAHRRKPAGSPGSTGGRFVPGKRPDDQVPSDVLSLPIARRDTATQPSKTENRAFFDEIAYMASVGPEVERLITQRASALSAYDTSQDSITRTRAAANALFETLDECLQAGGHQERHARIALRIHGLQVRRVKTSRFWARRRGVAPRQLPQKVNTWDWWASGDDLLGLSLLPLKQKA